MQALYGADHASSWSGRPGGTLATAQHPAPHDPITDGPPPPRPIAVEAPCEDPMMLEAVLSVLEPSGTRG